VADSDGARNGASTGDETSTGKARGNPFAKGTHYAPDDLVAIKVRHANREEFNDWYQGQYPGVNMLPARDAWADRVFALGLAEMKRRMPAQPSPEERWAKALESKS
jgi:hypothetical protein